LAFDVGLAVLVLGLAVWTTAARDTFAAVVGFVAFGLLLALVWVRLAAPDVALTEAAIGSGVTGVLLVGASTRLRPVAVLAAGAGPCAIQRLAAAVLCTLVTAGLAAIVLLLPEPAPTLAPQAAKNLGATGLGNPVTAVLMAFRAIDTLLETVETDSEYLTAWCDGGYTTNLALEDVVDGQAWVAYEYDGAPLPSEHGGPARLLVPHLYFWKSAKWVRGLKLTETDAPGFWETYGYHNHGDPWLEQRYQGD